MPLPGKRLANPARPPKQNAIENPVAVLGAPSVVFRAHIQNLPGSRLNNTIRRAMHLAALYLC